MSEMSEKKMQKKNIHTKNRTVFVEIGVSVDRMDRMDRAERERAATMMGARPPREQSSRPPPMSQPKAKDPMKMMGLKSNIKLSLVSKVCIPFCTKIKLCFGHCYILLVAVLNT
jgi:hypothetical protein